MSYGQVNAMLDADYPRGALNYWKSSFLAGLSDEAISAMIECFARCPSSMRGSGVVLEHVHGAASRIAGRDTPFPHRRDGYSLLVLAQWMAPTENERCTAWARDSFATMKPFTAEGGYVNYLDHDEAGDRVAAAYGLNYSRLRQLKARFDPDNFFHLNQNIPPPV